MQIKACQPGLNGRWHRETLRLTPRIVDSGLMGKLTAWLAFLLPLMSGVAWYAWSAHDFASSCGFRLPGHPSGPTTAGEIILIAAPGILVAAVQWVRTGSWLRTIGYGVLVAVLAGSAVAIAVFEWVANRCAG
jgi:hypothetical protein